MVTRVEKKDRLLDAVSGKVSVLSPVIGRDGCEARSVRITAGAIVAKQLVATPVALDDAVGSIALVQSNVLMATILEKADCEVSVLILDSDTTFKIGPAHNVELMKYDMGGAGATLGAAASAIGWFEAKRN